MESGSLFSKKFILALLVLALSFGLIAWGKLGGSEWVSIVTMVAGLYFAGNVGASFAYHQRKKEPLIVKSDYVDVEPLEVES